MSANLEWHFLKKKKVTSLSSITLLSALHETISESCIKNI